MNNTEKLLRLPNRIPVANVSALRLIKGKGNLDYAILLGKNSAGDNLAREYYWDPSSTAVDDGDAVIRPTSVGALIQGRWLIVGRQKNVARTWYSEFAGNGRQIAWRLYHTLSTRHLIVQVHEMGSTGASYDIAVEVEIRLYDDSIEIIFHSKVPTGTDRYRVLATEIII